MKKFTAYILILMLLLCSCGASESGSDPSGDPVPQKPAALTEADFIFTSESGKLELNKEFDPDSFGTYEYYEAASCGYSGLDKIYTYDTFEVYTYPDGEKDFISYIDLFEGAETSRGVKVGDKISVLSEKYGDDCEKNDYVVTYSLSDKELIFTIESEVITEIEFAYNDK